MYTYYSYIFSVASYLNNRHLHFYPLNKDDIEIGFGTKDKKSREERLTELDGITDRLSEDQLVKMNTMPNVQIFYLMFSKCMHFT